MGNPLKCLGHMRASERNTIKRRGLHTVNDQCRVRSSWLVEADCTPVVTRLAVVLTDCHIVLEELEPVEGL